MFDVGAYGPTFLYIKEKLIKEWLAGSFDEFLVDQSKFYGRAFKGHNFGNQWEQLAPNLDAGLQNYLGGKVQ